MLTTLYIENFVIVKQLELDFANGMTAFTGETGAGKSIMIDALMLALGGRADAGVIRQHEDKCLISATFQLDPGAEPAAWLYEHAVDFDNAEVILRRVLYKEGRSKSYINGHPFPVQKIKELSEMLVHIHGQHHHQTLMQHATHRRQLDNYAKDSEALQQVQSHYRGVQKFSQELQHLHNRQQHKERLELLRFQIDELESLNIVHNEMQTLSQEHQMLHHAKDYLQATQQIEQLLNDEQEPTIISQLNHVSHLLQQMPQEHKSISNTVELIATATIQCEEALSEIHHFSNHVALDPERLHEVEERIRLLHSAARKYQVDADELADELRRLQQEWQQIIDADDAIKNLEEAYQQACVDYQQSAEKLTAVRTQSADKLAQEITSIIQQLGMPKGRVRIDMSAVDKMQAHGMDKVEYKVSTNPGMPFDLLSKVASGGELSRISLAIQMVTAERGSTPTLLFDEVDVGIGGATAALVGRLLRKLGQRLQIFCVTHQPQVASAAHQHFVVEKSSDEQNTYSSIVAVNERERVDEIARMLGGLTITEQTRLHAKELLSQSHAVLQ